MSLLQDTTVFPTRLHGTPPRKQKQKSPTKAQGYFSQDPCVKSPVASLLDLARHPTAVIEAVGGWYDGSTKEQRQERRLLEARRRVLYLKLQDALYYRDWEEAAKELDVLEKNNEWKKQFASPDYCPEDLQHHIDQFKDARLNRDYRRMLFLVRTSLSRNLAQMGNTDLYKYSHIGTKDLIESYIELVLEAIGEIVDLSTDLSSQGLSTTRIFDQLLVIRQSFGRSALLLSGGATFGMNHIGVLKVLWEAKLLPRIISGASAGSIVSAVFCVKTDEEVPEFFDTFCKVDLAVFTAEGKSDSWLKKVIRVVTQGSMYNIKHLVRIMRGLLGDLTFMEAYNRTRRILNICVSSASIYELPRLLNYITAPDVLIWSAVAASCSVPLVFTAASLLAKDPKTQAVSPWVLSPQKWIDGSVDNDLPMQRLSEIFNVNHFIVSQVNPHVVPFLAKEEDKSSQEGQRLSPVAASPSWLNSVSVFAQSEAIYRLAGLADHGIFPNTLTKAVSVLSQTYSGDITILPEVSYTEFPSMLSNPTEEYMTKSILRGERATWPKLSRVRNHCAIELALDKAVNEVRAKAIFDDGRGFLTRSKSEHDNRSWLSLGDEPLQRRRQSQSSEPDPNLLEFARQNGYPDLKDMPYQKAHSIDLASAKYGNSFSFVRPTIDELRLPEMVASKVKGNQPSDERHDQVRADDACSSSSEDNRPQNGNNYRDFSPSTTVTSPPLSPSHSSRKGWVISALTQMTTRGNPDRTEQNGKSEKTKPLGPPKDISNSKGFNNVRRKTSAKLSRKKD